MIIIEKAKYGMTNILDIVCSGREGFFVPPSDSLEQLLYDFEMLN